MDNATKHQLKQPDQFVSLTEHGVDWAKNNTQKAFIAAGTVVVAILLIVGGYSLYQHRELAAANELGAAMQTYETPVQTPGQPLPPGTKSFATDKERATTANAQFVAVASKYSLTRSGKIAQYFAGLTYLDAGQNTSAEASLKDVASSWDHDLAASGKLALAQLYQQTGRDSQAADLYNELAKGNASSVPPGLAKIELAEMYTAEGKDDQARKIYAELKDKDKDSKSKPGPAAQLATEKLNPQKGGDQ